MTASAFDHPWLGGLLGDAEAAALWQAERQMAHMLAFERAFTDALQAMGRVTPAAAAAARARIDAFAPDMARLRAATARDGVVVPDLVAQLREGLADGAAIHAGATSQDVIDTALALTLAGVAELCAARLARVRAAIARLQAAFGANRIIGRTRMQAAHPIAAGVRLAAWDRPLAALEAALPAARAGVAQLQLGGAAGDRAALGADAEAVATHVAAALGLAAPAGVWHTDRHGIVALGDWLSHVTGALGKIGADLCLMAQQDVDEVRLSGSGGSSAMPHKANPVQAELLVTLARFNAAQLGGLHQALIHEQERSGAAWMLEWMLLPPMTVAAARALSVAEATLDGVEGMGRGGGAS